MIEVNGIAHVFVTVSDFARSRAFYARLLPALGMKPVLDGDGFFYCVGGRTAFGLRACDPEHAGERGTDDRSRRAADQQTDDSAADFAYPSHVLKSQARIPLLECCR